MRKNMIKYKNIYAVLFAGLLVSCAILSKYGLDVLEQVSSIIGSLSIGLALLTYYYNKQKDNRIAAINQISFFRREILVAGNDYMESVVKVKGSSYEFTRVKLDEPTYEYAIKHSARELNLQMELIQESKFFSKDLDVLNLLEELSLMIIYHKTLHHPALNSIRDSFVQLVENHAAGIFQAQNIGTGKSVFSGVLDVYGEWVTDADRRTLKERYDDFKKVRV
jgi:hypothetical protein